uniref:Uncharacterized protein n=1 Tax=Amphora coffeiformis TaxID=265554 RepID=A0A7S3KYA1_9STRA
MRCSAENTSNTSNQGAGGVFFARLPQAEAVAVGDDEETNHHHDDDDDDPHTTSNSRNNDAPAQLALRQVTTYHDDFSTSICTGLFADPYDRSACCAAVCCGTLLQDLNYHVVTGERPIPWWKRIGYGVAVLVVIPVLGSLFTTTSRDDPDAAVRFTLWGYLTAFLVWGIYSTHQRKALRLRILQDIMGQSVVAMIVSDGNPSITTPRSLTTHTTTIGTERRLDGCGCYRPAKVHRCCSCVERDVMISFRQVPYDASTEEEIRLLASQRDVCTALWQGLAVLCCGCCGCWWNCWGVCATAQEHRELRRKLPPERFALDYVTLQPYAEYVPLLEEVRDRQDTTLWGHLTALSKLSRSILWGVTIALLVVTANIFGHQSQPGERLVLVMATLGQALLVLYLVHWRYHRFDLSLDAIIKLFGAGFCFATGTAMVVELLTSMLGYLVLVIALVFEVVEDDPDDMPDSNDTDSNDKLHFLQSFAKRHIFTFVLFSAFNAFVVASLTEETAKYFSFWMVEHPDYDLQRQREQSLHTTAASITCGMVAVACGFACCENFLYIFGEGLSLSGELQVLLMRSCFPVHPICAAIQSIGICKRDVEHDGTKLGQALLPAVLLHGLFDFWLMVLGVLAFIHAPDIPEQTLAPIEPNGEKESGQQKLDPPSFSSLAISFLIVAVGLAYYFWASPQQRQRLNAMMATQDSDLSLALT